jgi:hypothetical protein
MLTKEYLPMLIFEWFNNWKFNDSLGVLVNPNVFKMIICFLWLGNLTTNETLIE